MIFEKEKYYKYITALEKMINFSYVTFTVIFFLIGLIWGFKGAIIGGIIGFCLATFYTLGIKIKVQEMKWKIDLYQKIK